VCRNTFSPWGDWFDRINPSRDMADWPDRPLGRSNRIKIMIKIKLCFFNRELISDYNITLKYVTK